MDRQFKAVDTRIKNDNFEILGYWDLVSPQLPNFPQTLYEMCSSILKQTLH